jgi:hypothetical protein
MARYLSPEWFDDVLAHQRPLIPQTVGAPLVVDQVVSCTPDGEVRYRVVVSGGRAVVEAPPREGEPDLTIACDWATATALAQGTLGSQAALLEGRLRVRGNLARIASSVGGLAGVDPIPPEVRRRTTF